MEEALDPVLASMAEANRILLAAGWRPFTSPQWGGTFTAGRAVGGDAPDGNGYVKFLDMVGPDDPRYGPDTPDEHHKAAAWLAERYKAPENALSLASLPEPEQTPAHEAHDETGVGAESATPTVDGGAADDTASTGVRDGAGGTDQEHQSERPQNADDTEPLDADFTEVTEAPAVEGDDLEPFAQIEAPDLGAEILETEQEESPQGSDRFIGLDDLDRRRSLRIGDVTVAAATRTPHVDWPTLAELRNFAMGVSENRWPNDDAKQAELLALEGVAAHRRQIEMLRDERVAFLLNATREEVEAFDPEAGWPS